MATGTARKGVPLLLPGRPEEWLTCLALDFNGTLAKDGRLLPGVAPRLKRLGKRLGLFVLTADTHGSAQRELARAFPVGGRPSLLRVYDGGQKALWAGGRTGLAAVGNGRNDLGLLAAARVGVAVLGPEGCHGALLAAADLVVRDVQEALDLFLRPKRLTAGLRP